VLVLGAEPALTVPTLFDPPPLKTPAAASTIKRIAIPAMPAPTNVLRVPRRFAGDAGLLAMVVAPFEGRSHMVRSTTRLVVG
jgi:hypothetical protein